MLDYKSLSGCPVFKGLSEEDSKNLLKKIHFQVKSFEKDNVIAVTGDRVANLLIIISGSVKGEMIDYSGKILKIEDIEAPKPLASAFLFGTENKFPVTVTANNDVKLLSVPVSEFLKLLQLNPQILKNYLNSISTRTQFLSRKLHFLSFRTIREKLTHFILGEAGERLNSFEIKSTQQQLADLFGVSRPSLARVIGEMQKEGIFRIDRKTLTILDKNRLNDILLNA
jgi:CRP-like cAMP-binding protein